MTLTIELPPELELQLQEEAARRGQDLATFAKFALAEAGAHAKSSANGGGARRASLEEFEAALDEFSAGTESLPVLPNEATTRAAIYGDHD